MGDIPKIKKSSISVVIVLSFVSFQVMAEFTGGLPTPRQSPTPSGATPIPQQNPIPGGGTLTPPQSPTSTSPWSQGDGVVCDSSEEDDSMPDSGSNEVPSQGSAISLIRERKGH